jgi:integrase/recombinase XerD
MLDLRVTRPFEPATIDPTPPRFIEASASPRAIDLLASRPRPAAFVRKVAKALSREDVPSITRASHTQALGHFLRWSGVPPHQSRRLDVEGYLAFLTEGGASTLQIERSISALRIAFDRLSDRRIAGAARSPPTPRTLPVPLEPFEIVRLLLGAPSLVDKLMLGIMYGTGSTMREVFDLRWSDVDVDRRTISIWQGRRRRRAELRLPACLEPLLRRLAPEGPGRRRFVFGPDAVGPPLVQGAFGAFVRAAAISRVQKPIASTTLRRSFAAHLVRNESDLRFVDRLFEGANLMRTMIYVPLRRRHDGTDVGEMLKRSGPAIEGVTVTFARAPPDAPGNAGRQANAEVHLAGRAVTIEGIAVDRRERGWLLINMPPIEDWRVRLGDLEDAARRGLGETALIRLLESEITRHVLEGEAVSVAEHGAPAL